MTAETFWRNTALVGKTTTEIADQKGLPLMDRSHPIGSGRVQIKVFCPRWTSPKLFAQNRLSRFFGILLLASTLPFLKPIGILFAELSTLVIQSPPMLHAVSPRQMAACQELLVNGDLEGSGGWRFGVTPAPGSVVDTPVHGGNFAIRLGIAVGTNTVAYSTAYQTVDLPATAEQITLTYWERPGATGDSGDYREVIALRPNFTALRSLERKTGAGNDQWTQRAFDITDLRGQSIVLYFNVYNNGSGATLVNYLDDLTLQSCDATTPPTATALPSATATPTPTLTPTTFLTPMSPTATATATPLPSSVIVRAGAATMVSGQTTVEVPLDLINAKAEHPVGVISIDMQYDATMLKATVCTVGDNFDLLLCNVVTPGLISMAGVAATGIRTDVRIANLGFDLLQPVNPSTPLTVLLHAVADTEGAALRATAQNGQVIATCTPGSEGCQTLFLPLVHR
jgi:hypothetical protein